MATFQYIAKGGLRFSELVSNDIVMVQIPHTVEPYFTHTFASQIRHGDKIVGEMKSTSELCNIIYSSLEDRVVEQQDKMLDALEKMQVQQELSESRTQLEALLEELKIQYDLLEAEISTSDSSMASRAKPFLNYLEASEGFNLYGIRTKIKNGEDLNKADRNTFIKEVYSRLRREHGATSRIREAIRQYIVEGVVDTNNLDYFKEYIRGSFNRDENLTDVKLKIQQYEAELREVMEKLDLEKQDQIQIQNDSEEILNLDKAFKRSLEEELDNIVSGQDTKTISIGDIVVDPYKELEELLGHDPRKPFVVEVSEVIEIENSGRRNEKRKADTGSIASIPYRIKKNVNIPDEFKPNYLSVENFGQLVTLFDYCINFTVHDFVRSDESLNIIYEELNNVERESINISLLMRAIFPNDHTPAKRLYSEDRLRMNLETTAKNRFIERVEQSKHLIPARVAQLYEIPEDELNFEELLGIQIELMQILPFQIYDLANLRSRFKDLKVNIQHIRPEKRRYKAIWDMSEAKIKIEFGTGIERIATNFRESLEQAIEIFGEQFGFMRSVLQRHPPLKN